MLSDFWSSIQDPELRTAWFIAMAADALQIAAFPVFAEGGVSPFDGVLDVLVAFLLVRLVGWHWAFLPSLVTEALPGVDLFPTWTAAMLFVSRERLKDREQQVIVAENNSVS